MTANTWTIDGIAASLLGTQPAPQPGESETYEFKLNPSADPNVPSVADRYQTLRGRWEHAGTLDMAVDFYDKAVYTEAGVGESLLVALEPVADPIGRGIWGLITGGSDEVEAVDDGEQEVAAQIDIDVAYIADLDEYADKTTVRRAHEREGWIR